MSSAFRPDRDFHILVQRRQEFYQPGDGEIARAVAHQSGHVGLLDAEDLSGLGLAQAALLDDLVDLQRQASLEKLLLRIGQSKIGKHVAAALLYPCFFLGAHLNSAFLDSAVLLPPKVAG